MYKTILQYESQGKPLSNVAGLDRQTMVTAFQHFDSVVLATDELILPQVSLDKLFFEYWNSSCWRSAFQPLTAGFCVNH